ncbi:transcription-repair coupling factor [Candidatus Peribacteria bacterium RIFCSPLOWO2_12_FULL_55_15]|nr:MAG: transcription-repair coupling factor [Candidatus Peribacteria bacterium RIFCSPHIGHO2_01_FULL_54_22]OGJ62893.1 MAG: transcription-repair coupling factor [Candidatus Peribacteria bacterium RIFCSPHIGHO2_02_FULL_55_24]OGJ65089.1 MAG: transcription-repair coupling factor [Candidatus Peribacteria bacterium RIFCSPHIGHO2_12_FULL_54_10]OGJ67279.1 MAG: transcription-repair coupling factor [Candidatus Peribacteria bacterium RIFCSPLOWO2_01_FULL_54_110]OGJ70011.1 MAG: transcription-repair coupling f
MCAFGMNSSILLGIETHRDIAQFLQKKGVITVSGLSNTTAKAALVAQLLSFYPQKILYLTSDVVAAASSHHQLKFFGVESVHLKMPSAHNMAPIDAVRDLLRVGDGCIGAVVSRDVFDTPLPSIFELREKSIRVSLQKNIEFTPFIEKLIEIGYRCGEDQFLQPGEYRRRGDTLDIFPVQSLCPFRLLFHINTVEEIFEYDQRNPQKVSRHNEVQLFPLTFQSVLSIREQIPSSTLCIFDDQDDVIFQGKQKVLRFTAFPETEDNHVHLRYLSVLKFYTLGDFLNDIRDKIHLGWRLLIITKRIDELRCVFRDENISSALHVNAPTSGITLFGAEEGDLLPHSIQNPDLRCALLTDREIFTLRKTTKQRSIQKIALDFITSLSRGDYVVHMEHGIGCFGGVTQKIVDGTVREYLELTYAEGDKLFVPVDQADKLSKYVYEEGKEPVLTRLGATEWKRVTEKIQQETQKVARELLDLYARRARAKGFAYPEDTIEMRAFEETFPFEETPGQAKAILEVKKDMEDDHPMDRLVCGDVGFGKTEVAMRAALKAVHGGKQAAIMAPSTILSDQHYHTFCERMRNFPVRVEMLSRFRTPKEQRDILVKLRNGEIHIIIGTHRLLQPDVQFFNLGLVIIDEEQKFGVKQKERFKELRSSVDVLTLTATPIPRTLNLGLHKLRDISIITTPPPGRLPIITEVRKYSDALVRHAVLQELDRKGQCFILYNRVETINAFTEKMRSCIPEARFIVGHGQLSPDDLEKRILRFKDGEVDVLVSSTIIENGIDLPRANTLIVNEAERLGLSQLYQLRGRVGRSSVQAYAYFLYHSQKLHDEAKKRLRAIVEACELGSGFQVAMRDLEIRGAGEILGASQSGSIQTVGVSHYLRMLKSAVEELRSDSDAEEHEVNVEILLPIEALIPPFYIPEEEERISMYQKLAGSEEDAILREFEGDIREEYGASPQPVRSLFALLHLKLACRRVGVLRVKMEEVEGKSEVVLFLSSRVTAKEVMQLVHKNPQWRISSATLRMAVSDLQKGKEEQWIHSLIQDILLLQKKGKKKKDGSRSGRGP